MMRMQKASKRVQSKSTKSERCEKKACVVNVSIRIWISEPSGRVAARRIESFPRSPSPQNQINETADALLSTGMHSRRAAGLLTKLGG